MLPACRSAGGSGRYSAEPGMLQNSLGEAGEPPKICESSCPMEKLAPAIAPPPGIGTGRSHNKAVLDWVQSVARLTQPENIFWCDGSERENDYLLGEAGRQDVLIKLNDKKVPRSYLHRSNPNDVARVEQFTFICTPTKREAGPTNNWSDPEEMYT